jgi:hypothetical protein
MSARDHGELGAVPVLRKPFRDVDLLARLQDALAVTPPFVRDAGPASAAE